MSIDSMGPKIPGAEDFRFPDNTTEKPGDSTVEIEPTLLVDGIIQMAKEAGLQINTYKSNPSDVTDKDATEKESSLETLEENIADLRHKAEATDFDEGSLTTFISFYLPTVIKNLKDAGVKEFLKNLSDSLRIEITNKRKNMAQQARRTGPKITGQEFK